MPMARRPGPLVLAAAIVLATIAAPAAIGGAAACAQDGPRAGLVVDTGVRVTELCVALDAAEVSGLHLIELAAAQHGLPYGFGLGGQAVCRLDGVGPAGDDCFAEYPEYWGYWHGDGRGGWTWASTGAGSYRVGDGDLEGWAWGSGDTGSSHRRPPAVAIDDLCESVAPPRPEPTRDPEPSQAPTRQPTPATDPSVEPSAASPTASPTARDRAERPDGSPSSRVSPTATPTSSDTEAPVLALGAAPPPDGGPPAGLFVAGVLALLLGAGGWLRLRSRSKGAV
jgi:hypothetical protein